LNIGDEVWIVFIGRGFEHGVYVRGVVARIDVEKERVRLRVRESSTTNPLATSPALLAAVAVRYRQVFLWPADHELREVCHLGDCAARHCLRCAVWTGLPRIDEGDYEAPAALRGIRTVPAYWIIPPRCFLYYNGRRPAPWVQRSTDWFAAFKIGEQRYAFPLAAGIRAALKSRSERRFEAIIPIPLSPDKSEAGELHRTGALAGELSRLTGTPVRSYLRLTAPISKRRMMAQGYTPGEFQARYRERLQVDERVARLDRILLLDDVITKGSTLSVAVASIRAANPAVDIVVAAAGQMIVKTVVKNEDGPAW
jgi:hypothetical protein